MLTSRLLSEESTSGAYEKGRRAIAQAAFFFFDAAKP